MDALSAMQVFLIFFFADFIACVCFCVLSSVNYTFL